MALFSHNLFQCENNTLFRFCSRVVVGCLCVYVNICVCVSVPLSESSTDSGEKVPWHHQWRLAGSNESMKTVASIALCIILSLEWRNTSHLDTL